ncbi:MAG: tyrosine-protein phosphatase [Armatimonadota bacterium]
MIDLHNHILRYVVPIHRTEPNIDIAVRMAEIAASDGIRIIVSTPHLRPADLGTDELVARLELMRAGVARLNRVLSERGIEMEVVGGAEVQLWESLPELAELGLLPTLGEGRHVLIELPIVSPATYAEQVLFALQLRGYRPVIAHFERMASAPVQETRAADLVARGIKLQVNAESLAGRRGREVQRAAQDLVRRGLVSALRSDAHDPEHSPPLLSGCRRAVNRAGGRGAFERLTWDSPLEIIGRAGKRGPVGAAPCLD